MESIRNLQKGKSETDYNVAVAMREMDKLREQVDKTHEELVDFRDI